MAIKATTLVAGLSFTFTLFTAGQTLAAQDYPTVVVVHVDNHARIPPDQLERSGLEVTRIYERAGIHMIWVEGDGQADPASTELDGRPAAVHVRVLLLSRDMAISKIARERIPANVVGRAAGPTGRAYILTHRVAELTARNRWDFDLVLARVIAHEVGHLLLPPNSHSTSGIMRETLDISPGRSETFTGAQRKAMLSALTARD